MRQTHTAYSMTLLLHETAEQMAPAAQSDVHVKHLCFSALTSVPSPRTFCSFFLRSRSSDAFLLPSFAGTSLGTTVTKDKMLLFLPMWLAASLSGRLFWQNFARKAKEMQLWPSVLKACHSRCHAIM